MNILIISGLSDKKLISKIEPIADLDYIKNIFLVRRYPLKFKKVVSYNPPGLLRKNILSSELCRVLILLYIGFFKKVDVIIGIFLILHGTFAAIFGRFFSKPVIQVLPGSDLQAALKYKFLFKIIKKADVVIARGENSKKSIIDRGVPEHKIFCPPNVFNFEIIPELKEHGIKQYDVIFVGNLVEVKRLDILLCAIKLVKNKYRIKNIKLVMVGDGHLRGKLEQMAVDMGIDENVFFTGWHEYIYYYLLKSKLFVMTSQNEGLPMAMIEAMSCGLPCIISDVGEINTIIRDGENSLLVPRGDVEAFAKGIHLLITDRKLYNRLSLNALKIREERKFEYSLKNIKGIWNKILSDFVY